MIRLRWGATFWTLGLLTFPAQYAAAALWPQRYSWASNLISDLGVTTCGTFDAGTRVERYLCSPGHMLANGSTIANGAFLAVGAVLLWSVWPRRRTGKIAMVFLAMGGVLVMMVGFLPWDLYPEAHDVVALAQAAVQWVGMIILAFALRGSAAARWTAVLTIAGVLISIIGFVLFIDAISGGPSLALGLGITERIAFDTLTLWGAAVGFILIATSPKPRPTAERHHASKAPATR
ncbi:putative membrane protein [Arthrobacter sp. UYNi723]